MFVSSTKASGADSHSKITPSSMGFLTTSELSKVEGLGESHAKKIKNMLTTKNKLQKESNQKTLT